MSAFLWTERKEKVRLQHVEWLSEKYVIHSLTGILSEPNMLENTVRAFHAESPLSFAALAKPFNFFVSSPPSPHSASGKRHLSDL